VPNAAVHRIGSDVGVWALRDGDLGFVPVKLGVEDADGWVQVLDGLAKGDKVVLHSARPLTASSRITVVDKQP
jgi:HlyD family secretion protein